MNQSDFKLTLLSEQTPHTVYQAVNNVREWWSGYHAEEIHGRTENLNDEFSFRAEGGAHHTMQKLVEVIPDKKVVWLITDSQLNYLEKKDEWLGTKVIFDISEKDGKTQLVFTHEGLTPEAECYDSCAPSWTQYLQNKLLPLINSGKTA
ncbi:SRPBCC family protein [Dyadobacter arcticus]|uniref:Activator of Hsp90 ATPase homologue 1/2-like C-terminal domain-containing protein n=1 Tax=Dyadobacter arcticus TaxID=1078754 RepID=A0ABX0UHH4_9BACT|nr:SRPBCC domain-containing protein [Dyadobacter arcticus]NIJ52472.1 hypothetical protein [Dyadobacter arcticus]